MSNTSKPSPTMHDSRRLVPEFRAEFEALAARLPEGKAKQAILTLLEHAANIEHAWDHIYQEYECTSGLRRLRQSVRLN